MIRAVDLQAAVPVTDLDGLLAAELRPAPTDRPWVMLNMVTSLDGATAVAGGATALSDPDDQTLFLTLRGAADVVLVGAATVRAEDYGPVRVGESTRAVRTRSGRAPAPRLAVLSASGHLDPTARLFSDPGSTPYVFTGRTAATSRLEALGPHAEVVVAGEEGADLPAVLARLSADGHRVLLCEGGPSVNGQLVAADVVDEIHLTFSPLVVGGLSSRLVDGLLPLVPPMPFRLDRLLRGERALFARYLRVPR